MNRIEELIFQGLLYNEDYARRVVPHLHKEYFSLNSDKIISEQIIKFFTKYNKSPTPESLIVDISNRSDIGQSDFNDTIDLVDQLKSQYEKQDDAWLIENTEKFCRDRALYNALYEAMYIVEGKDKGKNPDSIPSILSQALSISFDTNIGHDYLDDYLSRYDFYHRKEEKLPFGLEIFDKITDGGLSKKTLTVVMSGPGGGKSLFLCHNAASALIRGKNVLYITMEMSEERIGERIDANLFNMGVKDIKHMELDSFNAKIDRIKSKTNGKLIIKEYPTGSAHSGHFRALIEDLKLKRGFLPDLIIVDYLNICTSQRVKYNNANSYSVVGSIAEELRSLGMEYNVPVLTATQSKTDAIMASDVDMTDAADSIGIARTTDLMFAMIRTEELDELGQVMVKQLKNRYGDVSYYKRFVLGLDLSRMKVYDVENEAQSNITPEADSKKDDMPVFDRSRISTNSKILPHNPSIKVA